MTEPPAEETITIVDDSGREKTQRVAYTVTDIRGEIVYVTEDGLEYIRDSLNDKPPQRFLLDELERIAKIVSQPDIVVRDYFDPQETLVYYGRAYVRSKRARFLLAVVVKVRSGRKFLYNFYVQESNRVKGAHLDVPPEVWYMSPKRRRKEFGL